MIKFDRTAADQGVSTPDDARLTLGAAVNSTLTPWSVAFIISFDGLTSGDNPQYILSTGNFGAAGSLNIYYNTTGAGSASAQGKIFVFANTTTNALSPALSCSVSLSSGTHLFIVDMNGTQGTLRHCPILSSAPTDGSAVVLDGTSTSTHLIRTLNGAGFKIGSRLDDVANRKCDQSLGRVFVYGGILTDLEVARLAFGEELSDLGHTPVLYSRLNAADAAGVADRSANAFPMTIAGTPTTSAEPAFGYVPGGTPAPAPAITGTPALTGTVQVGQVVGYTPAAATGSSGRTQQWLLDGVAVQGATGSTYTPIDADADKVLTVRQTETNATGSTSATSAGTAVAAAPASPSTLDFTPLAAIRIAQRGYTVPLAITYTGADPTNIEYQLYAADGVTVRQAWTAIDGEIVSAGSVQAAALFPAGGPYRLQLRSLTSSGAELARSTIATNTFQVGALIGIIGSSSAAKLIDSTSGTGFTPNAATGKMSGTSFAWSAMSSNGAATLMADRLQQQSGVPVGLLTYGVSGTTLAQWLGNGTSWTNFANAVTAAGGKLEAVYITVGSNDAENGTLASRAAHLANMKALINRVRTLTGQPNLPVLWSGSNRRPALPVAQVNFLRMAENDVGDEPYVTHIQTMEFDLASDEVHLAATANGYPASAARTATVWGRRLYGDGVYRRGPKISSIVVTGTTGIVTLTHRGGADFQPAASITGFAATDSSGNAVTVTAARVDATHIQLSFSAQPSKVTYLFGPAPDITAAVFDNGAVALPMAVETDLAVVQETVTQTYPVSAQFPQTYDIIAPQTYQVSAQFPQTYDIFTLTQYQVSAQFPQTYDIVSEYTMAFNPSAIRTLKVKAGSRAFEGSTAFWTLGGAKGPVGRIDPDASIDITLDWTEVLADIQDTIASVLWIITGGTNAGTVSVGAKTSLLVSTASNPEVAITCRITTASLPARTEDRTIYLTVGQE